MSILPTAITDIPQFVQIQLVQDPFKLPTQYPVPMLYEFFAGRIGRTMLQFGREMRFLVSPFHMFYCIDSYCTDSHHNRAIQSLTADVVPAPRAFPGTVMFLRIVDHANPTYANVRPRDVLDIREYFVHFR